MNHRMAIPRRSFGAHIRQALLLTCTLVAATIPSSPSAAAGTPSYAVDQGDVVVPPGSESVYRLYLAYFDREPESEGFWFWADHYATYGDLTYISNQFAEAPEYGYLNGNVGSVEFINRAYEVAFGRPADEAGQEYWLGRMDSGVTRGAVMVFFSDSVEFRTKTGFMPSAQIRRLFQSIFLRQADAPGLAYWLGRSASGLSSSDIAAAMVDSPEFRQRYGQLQDDEFVNLVYRNVLSRVPDTSGADHWRGQLASGLSRGELMIGFSDGSEYQEITGLVDIERPTLPTRPDPDAPKPVVPCDFEVGAVFEVMQWQEEFHLMFPMTQAASGTSCLEKTNAAELTLYGERNGGWTFHSTNRIVEGDVLSTYLRFVVPEESFDQNQELHYSLTLQGPDVDLLWSGIFTRPLSYAVELETTEAVVPEDALTVELRTTVAPTELAPSREVVVQASTLSPACTLTGEADSDGWVEVGSGVPPLDITFVVTVQPAVQGLCAVDTRTLDNFGGNRIYLPIG